MSLKIEKRAWKISKSGGFFQVLTHDHKDTNDIQMDQSPRLGILQHFKELSTKHFKITDLSLKVEKKPEKALAFFNF